MALETEVKVRLFDYEAFKARLIALAPRILDERHFEDNRVLDHPDGRLVSLGCLLRVRGTRGRDSVTFKGPVQASALFKTREELETTVGSADMMAQIFEQIGLQVWFRYQKYREEYAVPVRAGEMGEIKVALDVTPIGEYAELEGSEAGIRELAERLGIAESEFLRDSYHSLYVKFCRERGESPEHMVFR